MHWGVSALGPISNTPRDEAHIVYLRVGEEQAVPISEPSLPTAIRAICIYRNDPEFLFAEPDPRLTHDDVVVLARANALKVLRERFG